MEWIVGPAVVGIGTIATILLGLRSLEAKHRSGLELQEQHLRNQLRLDVFRELMDQLHETADKVSDASHQAWWIVSQLKLQLSGVGSVTVTSEDLIEANHTAARSTTDILRLFERYEIVFHRFRTARAKLSEEHTALLDSFREFKSRLGLFVPFRSGPNPHPFPATAEDVDKMEPALQAYQDVCGNIQGYIIDLQIEAQNELLGDIFRRTLPPRNPLDPQYKVLERDPGQVPWLEREPGRLT